MLFKAGNGRLMSLLLYLRTLSHMFRRIRCCLHTSGSVKAHKCAVMRSPIHLFVLQVQVDGISFNVVNQASSDSYLTHIELGWKLKFFLQFALDFRFSFSK